MSDNKLVVLITGANQGLGYHTARHLALTGHHHILIGSRATSNAEKAIKTLTQDDGVDPSNLSALHLDVDSDASIAAAAQTVQREHGRLDVLMLNAGIVGAAGSTREQYARVYNTNVFGAAVTVDAFLPLLRKSTAAVGGRRIVFTSSSFGSIALAVGSEGFDPRAFPPQVSVYRSSKAAVNMVMGVYAKMLESEGFVVAAADPGFCATAMNGYSGVKDASEGARVLVRAATGDKEEVHGRVIDEDGVVPW